MQLSHAVQLRYGPPLSDQDPRQLVSHAQRVLGRQIVWLNHHRFAEALEERSGFRKRGLPIVWFVVWLIREWSWSGQGARVTTDSSRRVEFVDSAPALAPALTVRSRFYMEAPPPQAGPERDFCFGRSAARPFRAKVAFLPPHGQRCIFLLRQAHPNRRHIPMRNPWRYPDNGSDQERCIWRSLQQCSAEPSSIPGQVGRRQPVWLARLPAACLRRRQTEYCADRQ